MVLLTGGTGFAGSFILYYLLQEHKTVRATRRAGSSLTHLHFVFERLAMLSEGGSAEDALSRIEWVEADILDVSSMQEAVEGMEEVYHAAAIVSFNRKERDKLLHNNIEGTANVVNACLEAGVKKLAYVSSVAALARQSNAETDENAFIEGRSFSNAYSESKYRAEMEVWRGIAEGLPAVIINPVVILGWGNFRNTSLEIIRTIDKGLSIYPGGSNSFVDARDVAKGLIALMKNEAAVNKRFIASAGNMIYKMLFDRIGAELGVKPPTIRAGKQISWLAGLASEGFSMLSGTKPFITREIAETSSNDYHYSNRKMTEMLDYHFRPLEDTIKDCCAAYKEWKKLALARVPRV
jgi:nucleoside-diphosphate-sugar epimerase